VANYDADGKHDTDGDHECEAQRNGVSVLKDTVVVHDAAQIRNLRTDNGHRGCEHFSIEYRGARGASSITVIWYIRRALRRAQGCDDGISRLDDVNALKGDRKGGKVSPCAIR
jgi:hypothetical protein